MIHFVFEKGQLVFSVLFSILTYDGKVSKYLHFNPYTLTAKRLNCTQYTSTVPLSLIGCFDYRMQLCSKKLKI